MFLDGKSTLHIIDTATHFSGVTFPDIHEAKYGQSVQKIWLAFVIVWCTLSTIYPNRLDTDQGSEFKSDKW